MTITPDNDTGRRNKMSYKPATNTSGRLAGADTAGRDSQTAFSWNDYFTQNAEADEPTNLTDVSSGYAPYQAGKLAAMRDYNLLNSPGVVVGADPAGKDIIDQAWRHVDTAKQNDSVFNDTNIEHGTNEGER